MAKRTSTPEAAKRRPGRPATGKQPHALRVRGRAAWKAWLEECADSLGEDVTKFVETATADRAASLGLPPAPPRT